MADDTDNLPEVEVAEPAPFTIEFDDGGCVIFPYGVGEFAAAVAGDKDPALAVRVLANGDVSFLDAERHWQSAELPKAGAVRALRGGNA